MVMARSSYTQSSGATVNSVGVDEQAVTMQAIQRPVIDIKSRHILLIHINTILQHTEMLMRLSAQR